MTFRTELPVAPLASPLPPRARVLTLGSCFAAVLGQKLAGARLPVLDNPFGTVLNPVSACRLLAGAAGSDDYDLAERKVLRDGRWFSYDMPSALSGATPEELDAAIGTRLGEVRDFVRAADVLVLTMGTAWAWRLDGEVVANCHKQPGGLFEKSLLSVQEIVAAFAEAHSWLLRLNPKLRVVLTVSPVRHPKETLPGSSVSKSTLRLACHYLDGLVRDVSYFPAYELLLDDLRDYRFYAADMVHPSPLAEEYIFGKFVGAYFDARFAEGQEAWADISRALAHRSSNPKGEEHQRFLLLTLDKLDALAAQGYDVTAEAAALSAQLTKPRKVVAVVAKPVDQAPAESLPVAAPAAPAPPTKKPIIKIDVAALTPPAPRGAGRRGQPVPVPSPPPPPKPVPAVAAAPPTPTPPPVTAEPPAPPTTVAPTEASPAAADEQGQAAGNRKRRGKRGGRRSRNRREAAQAAQGQLFEQKIVEAAPAAAELALPEPEPLPEAAPPVPPPFPAEEVVAENALSGLTGAAAPTEAADSESSTRANGRRPGRDQRGKGGAKKVVLQKVKSAPPAAATPEPPAPEAPAPPPPQPKERTKPAPKGRQQAGKEKAEVPAAAPVAVAKAPTPPAASRQAPKPAAKQARPQAKPAPALKSAPVVEVTEAPAPPATEQRTARTPSKGKAKGPVATPAQKATAARTVKKAGVGALLLALGSAAAPAAPAPAPPPAPTPVPPPPTPTPAPVLPPPKAEAAPKPKRPAKPRTPKKS